MVREDLRPKKTELSTSGAYNAELLDISGNGLTDIFIPSAWEDLHNPGALRNSHVFIQDKPRHFVDKADEYGILSSVGLSVAACDLNKDGETDLVIANLRSDFEYDTDSYVYMGIKNGFVDTEPIRLPTHYAHHVETGDLSGDGYDDIVFSGGGEIRIFWNRNGSFSAEDFTTIQAVGDTSIYGHGHGGIAIADIDLDGKNELIFSSVIDGYSRHNEKFPCYVYMGDKDYHYGVDTRIELPIGNASSGYVIADTDLDGYPELVISNSRQGEGIRIFPSGPDGPDPSKFSVIPGAGGQ